MKYLILYGTKYGTTEICAKKLSEYITEKVDVVNVDNVKNIILTDYDTVIIGSSVYVGIINKEIKEFIELNIDILLSKKVGLFLCCMSDKDKVEEQFNVNIPKELLEKALIKDSFGGEFKFSKMNFIEKQMIKMICKKDPNIGKVSGKEDISKINEESICQFAKAVKK